MRLIDADALEYHKQLEAMGNGQYEDVKVVYECDIYNAPTIDAEPVKHGEWVAAHIGETTSWYVECSECHVVMPPVNYSYCPNCGAKMTGGEG